VVISLRIRLVTRFDTIHKRDRFIWRGTADRHRAMAYAAIYKVTSDARGKWLKIGENAKLKLV